MRDTTLKPHDFWLTTCGFDTHERGPGYARLDTPWNTFTRDGSALVCTLWVDQIVEIFDPQLGRPRRFVKLGGRSKAWKGVAVKHGDEARANLERAFKNDITVFGFEAEPNAAAIARGERSVKHFYFDRACQLQSLIGLTRANLNDRLYIEQEFNRRGIANDLDKLATLFELVDRTAEVPGHRHRDDGDSHSKESKVDREDERPSERNLSNEEYAPIVLRLLVAHVLGQRDGILVPITYLKLAELIGRRQKDGSPWARGLGDVLGRVTAMIEATTSNWAERPPYLTTVVVASGPGGLPLEGVEGLWPGYTSFTRAEKEAKVRVEYERILRFGSHWLEILRLLELESHKPEDGAPSGARGWGGGESDEHKALKAYVCNHPELFGADPARFTAFAEYPLRSLDVIDVLFRCDDALIGVEVKSRVSDGSGIEDYLRGIYQVVKYRALLEAQALADNPGRTPPKVRVVLGLESTLPAECRSLADLLRVDWVERISPNSR